MRVPRSLEPDYQKILCNHVRAWSINTQAKESKETAPGLFRLTTQVQTVALLTSASNPGIKKSQDIIMSRTLRTRITYKAPNALDKRLGAVRLDYIAPLRYPAAQLQKKPSVHVHLV